MRQHWMTVTAATMLLLSMGASAWGQPPSALPPGAQAKRGQLAPDTLSDVTIEQKLGAQVPLDLSFKDETGRDVTLRQYFGDRPVILTLAYNRCPMLCTQVLNGLVKSLRVLNFNPGQEFELVTVSIDPTETPQLALEKKESYVRFYDREGASGSWHFLTGSEASIRSLAAAVGFRYVYDSVSTQYAHASGIMVVTPDGRVAAYQYGIEFSPKDLRLSLVEAGEGRIGSAVDQLILLCYEYDPLTGKYGLVIRNSLQIGAVITVLALGGFLFVMLRRERRAKSVDAGLTRLGSGMNN